MKMSGSMRLVFWRLRNEWAQDEGVVSLTHYSAHSKLMCPTMERIGQFARVSTISLLNLSESGPETKLVLNKNYKQVNPGNRASRWIIALLPLSVFSEYVGRSTTRESANERKATESLDTFFHITERGSTIGRETEVAWSPSSQWPTSLLLTPQFFPPLCLKTAPLPRRNCCRHRTCRRHHATLMGLKLRSTRWHWLQVLA